MGSWPVPVIPKSEPMGGWSGHRVCAPEIGCSPACSPAINYDWTSPEVDKSRGVCAVRRSSTTIFLISVLILSALALMGAGPNQDQRPPQPFFQDFFSGAVLLQGSPPPEGTQLIACIDDCDAVFQSAPYSLNAGGTFDQLQVDPSDEGLIGHTIYFYLVNEFGRIRAEESRPYIGVFDFYVQDLTFTEPLPVAPPIPLPEPTPVPAPTPVPTPTAVLPIAGDPSVALVPRMALMAGGAALVAGTALLLAARRKAN